METFPAGASEAFTLTYCLAWKLVRFVFKNDSSLSRDSAAVKTEVRAPIRCLRADEKPFMFTRETASVARRCHRDGETTASHRASAAPDSAQPDMTTACGFGRAGGRGADWRQGRSRVPRRLGSVCTHTADRGDRWSVPAVPLFTGLGPWERPGAGRVGRWQTSPSPSPRRTRPVFRFTGEGPAGPVSGLRRTGRDSAGNAFPGLKEPGTVSGPGPPGSPAGKPPALGWNGVHRL